MDVVCSSSKGSRTKAITRKYHRNLKGKKKGKKTHQETATKLHIFQMLVRKASLFFPLQSILQEIQP